MASVFISHSSADRPVAERIAEAMRTRGFESLFLDVDPNDGLRAGEEWTRGLYTRLRRAEAVVFLASPASVSSQWCFAEAAFARSERKPVFPVRIADGARLSLLEDLQWIDVVRDGERALDRLWLELDKLAGATFAWDESRPPYPGLEPFQEADAAMFFGRDDEVAELLGYLQRGAGRSASRIVAVIGGSGTGKSSLVRGGLIPRMRRLEDDWIVVPPFTPEDDPVAQLAAALAEASAEAGEATSAAMLAGRLKSRGGGGGGEALAEIARELRQASARPRSEVLVVVDQAEELVTQVASPVRESFLEMLASSSGGGFPLWILLTLRSEFQPRLPLGIDRSFVIAPLDPARIPAAVEGPARRAGIDFEEGLVDRIVRDTHGGDALPLLAFTLRRLHDAARDGRMNIASYEAHGGVLGALAQQADAAAAPFDERGERALVLSTLLKLVTVDAQGTATRRAVRDAAVSSREAAVVDSFVDARLLVSRGEGDERSVSIAHEALLRAWSPLEHEIEARRQILVVERDLERLADQWSQGGGRDYDLLSDQRLVDVLARLRDPLALGGDGHSHDPHALLEEGPAGEYLEASLAYQRALDLARRRRRRFRALSVAAAFLVLMVIATVAFAAQRNATRQKRRAQDEQRVATQRQVAAQATAEVATDPELAVLMARSAIGAGRVPEAVDALRLALDEAHGIAMLRGHALAAAFTPDGRVATVGKDAVIRLWDPRREHVVRSERIAGMRSVEAAAFSGDGRRVVVGDIGARVIDIADGTTVARSPDAIDFYSNSGMALDESGTRIVASLADGEATWQIAPPLRRLNGNASPDPAAVALSADGRRAADVDNDGRIFVWSTEGPRREVRIRAPGPPGLYDAVAVSPSGDRVFASEHSGIGWIFSGKGPTLISTLRGHTNSIYDAQFTASGRQIATGSDDGTARIWDAETGETLATFRGQTAPIFDVGFSPDGRSLLTVAGDGTTRVWQVPTNRRLRLRGAHRSTMLAVSDDGSMVVTADAADDHVVRLWRLPVGTIDTTLPRLPAPVESAAVSADANRVLLLLKDDGVRVWDRRRAQFVGTPQHIAGVLGALDRNGDRAVTWSSARTAPSGRGRSVLTSWRVSPTAKKMLLRLRADVNSAAFDAHGTRIVIAEASREAARGRIEVRDATSGKVIWARDQVGTPSTASFDPSGSRVASGTSEGTARIWRLDAAPQPIATLRGYRDVVSTVRFSPDGSLLLTALGDGSARVWSTTTGALIVRLPGHERYLYDAVFTPDGAGVVTTSDDGKILLHPCQGCGTLAQLLRRADQSAAPDHLSSDARRTLARAEAAIEQAK